ncbi:hypothetical protein [Moraxella lacunata]|uniref:hypothetical protein n=1 Tax=Moraxella lacunata TaxID=477 RepID=UPI003EE3847C
MHAYKNWHVIKGRAEPVPTKPVLNIKFVRCILKDGYYKLIMIWANCNLPLRIYPKNNSSLF